MGRIGRLLFTSILVLAGYYAVFGGEYSWLELRQARTDLRLETESLSALTEQNEALSSRLDSLEHDNATLERLARDWGMIYDGEIIYRYSEPSGAGEDNGAG